jgi:peptidoglycan/xylan/chitin deacetylase (PgdA/CDA1 family)
LRASHVRRRDQLLRALSAQATPMGGEPRRVLVLDATTPDALKRERVRATFFVFGRNAAAAPAPADARPPKAPRSHRSFAQPWLGRMRTEAALADIDRGISVVKAALGEGGSPQESRDAGSQSQDDHVSAVLAPPEGGASDETANRREPAR